MEQSIIYDDAYQLKGNVCHLVAAFIESILQCIAWLGIEPGALCMPCSTRLSKTAPIRERSCRKKEEQIVECTFRVNPTTGTSNAGYAIADSNC